MSLDELEVILGTTLPPDYRKWIGDGRRAFPKNNFFWVVTGDWGSVLDKLYGLSGPESLKTYALQRAELKVPSSLLLIGDDGIAGTYLAIGIEPTNQGKIYYVDTNEAEYGEIVGEMGIHQIGGSFYSWIKSLQKDPDG